MRAGDLARLAVVTLGAAASIATPAPAYRYPRNYPVWQVESGATFDGKCVSATAWVAKSGKTGFGLTLELVPTRGAGCHVSIGGGSFTAGVKRLTTPGCPFDVDVPAGGPTRVYLPFYFDNENMWNDGVRRGELELVLWADGVEVGIWKLTMVHRYDGPHRKIGRGQEAEYQP
jgi:hypothetical protein